MAVWLVCFFVIFALAEFFDWVKGFSLPLPISILGGAFLAIASNYNKIFGTYFPQITPINTVNSINSINLTEIPNSPTPISLPVDNSVKDDLHKSLPESHSD